MVGSFFQLIIVSSDVLAVQLLDIPDASFFQAVKKFPDMEGSIINCLW